MMADWVAVATRGRALMSRRIGREGARQLARSSSLEAALAELARTPYARALRPAMDLRSAQHAVTATVLWHVRVLAGWAPPQGVQQLRVLAGAFEIANVVGRFAALAQRPADRPYALGALATAWPRLVDAESAALLRDRLRASPWRDPETSELGDVRAALEAAWARRVADAVPAAARWAAGYAALIAARATAAGAPLRAERRVASELLALLGSNWSGAPLAELPERLPRAAGWVLAGIRTAPELWRAEARWWRRVESDAATLCALPQSAGTVLGVVGLLAADAWRTRAALALAAGGGGELAEVLDAVA